MHANQRDLSNFTSPFAALGRVLGTNWLGLEVSIQVGSLSGGAKVTHALSQSKTTSLCAHYITSFPGLLTPVFVAWERGYTLHRASTHRCSLAQTVMSGGYSYSSKNELTSGSLHLWRSVCVCVCKRVIIIIITCTLYANCYIDSSGNINNLIPGGKIYAKNVPVPKPQNLPSTPVNTTHLCWMSLSGSAGQFVGYWTDDTAHASSERIEANLWTPPCMCYVGQ